MPSPLFRPSPSFQNNLRVGAMVSGDPNLNEPDDSRGPSQPRAGRPLPLQTMSEREPGLDASPNSDNSEEWEPLVTSPLHHDDQTLWADQQQVVSPQPCRTFAVVCLVRT